MKAGKGSAAQTAETARRELKAQSRPHAAFDASRYFRGTRDLGFYNVGMPAVRSLARRVVGEHRESWTVDDALAFADALVRDRFLEVKLLGVEAIACYRRDFAPRHLAVWKRWLADDHAANWATTDAICGLLIGPLLLREPKLLSRVATWSRHRNMWVRRAAAVSFIPSARKGVGLDLAYGIARTLHADREDLIQKAVGWMLRESGKTDSARLETYLRENGPAIPRTTVRYAIEKFSAAKRKQLLEGTKAGRAGRAAGARR